MADEEAACRLPLMCGTSQTFIFRSVSMDHRRMVAMAQHLVPFTLGIIAPLSLIGWLLLH